MIGYLGNMIAVDDETGADTISVNNNYRILKIQTSNQLESIALYARKQSAKFNRFVTIP
jgi:hypothetical protein